MRLIDTSAWIEYLSGTAIGLELQKEFPEKPDWLVPTIVQLELAKWLTREMGETKGDQVVAFTHTCVVADLTTSIALQAANLCVRQRLATADAIVYATALHHATDLLTCDRHFEGLPNVKFIPKTPLTTDD